MLHLIKYNILVKLRNFNMTFWPLVFPLILGTFFFFAFGNLNDADFETVQVALVRETTSNPLFDFYLEQVQKSDSDLINIHELTEQKALTALKNKEISGIYYTGMTPSLTINAQFLPVYWYESINETLSRYHVVSGKIAVDIWKSMGIEIMFTLALLALILAVSKYKRQG